MRVRYFYPLAGHVIVTLGIGFGYVIPGTCVAGMNDLSVGFVASVAGTCLAYWAGVLLAVRDRARLL
jgi:hypothetical protein